MRNLLFSINRVLPQPLRTVGMRLLDHLPFALKYGSTYRQTLKFLLQSQHWDIDQIRSYQLQTLQSLIQHAYTNVPFYHNTYSKQGIHPSDIRSLKDIHALPMVSKSDLRNFRDDFKAMNFPASSFQYHTTGGSTARPVGLYWQADRTVPMEKAFQMRQFQWIGHDPDKDVLVNIRGIPPANNQDFERVGRNHYRLSSYHLTPAVLNRYVDLINTIRPRVLHAYPSSAMILAGHLLDSGASLPSVQLVLLGSEQLFDWQRTILTQAFSCRLYSWYGQSEYVSLAGECEHSSEYHFYPEYGIAEILRPDGTSAQGGEIGEIVATGFLNYAFPLIRYRMEDLARLSVRGSCECGRHFQRADKIEGRIQEMIMAKEGNLISMTAINMHDDTFDTVHQFQFVQESKGALVLNVVPKASYTSASRDAIAHAMRQKLSDQFDITILEVEQIEQTIRGKTRFLVQKLDIGGLWHQEG